MEHTPTPWRIGDAGHTVFGPPNGNPSPKTVAGKLSIEDAKLIVRAVNAHKELIKALTSSVELMEGLKESLQGQNPKVDEELAWEIKNSKQAVAKAEGERS